MSHAIVSDKGGQIGSQSVPLLPLRPVAQGAGFTGKDFVRILRKRKWMILITVIVFVAIAAAATFLWLRFSPFYTPEAFLEVNLTDVGLNGRATPDQPTREVMDRLQSNYAKSAGSDEVFREVLNEADPQYNIKTTEWYRSRNETAIHDLNDEVHVSPVANSNYVKVWMTGRDPREATLIVNAVAYKAEVLSRRFATADTAKTIAAFQEEIDGKKKVLAQIYKEMQANRPGDIPMIEDARNNLFAKRDKIDGQLSEINAKVIEARSKAEIIKSQDIRNSPEVLQMLEGDSVIRSLKAYQIQLQNEHANLVRKFGPQHRTVKDVETKLEEVEKQVAKATQDTLDQLAAAYKADVEGKLAQLLDQQTHLSADLMTAEAQIKDSEKAIERIRQLGDDEKSVLADINRYETKKMELRTQVNAGNPLRVKMWASTPYEPSSPKWVVMIPVGFVLGLLVGLGLAFLLEMVDTSVKSSSDILRRIDLPMLGMVPHVEDLEDDIADVRLAFMTNPNSMIGEAFRQIRTTLLYSGPAEKRRSLLVTSPLPEDGRTTVAVNLGAAMARDGRRVLVIDANFRQPAIRQLFPQVKEAGLCNVLVGQGKWQDCVCEVEPRLSVLSSGPLPPNPAELLGSEAMRSFIREVTASYDQVIFDGAPCLVVSDSAILSTLVDGTILVVRAGSNTHGIVQRMRDIFTRVGSHILGVTLNGVRATSGGYLRKSYETFYDYHEQQIPQAALPQK